MFFSSCSSLHCFLFLDFISQLSHFLPSPISLCLCEVAYIYVIFVCVYFPTMFSFCVLFVDVLLFQMKFSASAIYQKGVCFSLLSLLASSLYDFITWNWIDKWMFNLRLVATSCFDFCCICFLKLDKILWIQKSLQFCALISSFKWTTSI